MTSEIDVNTNENNVNDKANKRSFFALAGKAARGVVFFFFLLGLTATTLVASRVYLHLADAYYEKTGEDWDVNGQGRKVSSDPRIRAFRYSNITDSELESLAGRRDVFAVYLVSCPNITDKCVESLSRIPNLRRLVIENCGQIQNPDFSKLAKLRKLKRLSVRFCPCLTDESAQKIARLRSLKILHLTGCSSLTPQSVSQFKSLPLVEFAPPECVLKDETVSEITKIKRLRYLYVAGKKDETLPLTETGLAALAEMEKIREIRVENCPNISDESLSEIANKTKAQRGMWEYDFLISSDRKGNFISPSFTYVD